METKIKRVCHTIVDVCIAGVAIGLVIKVFIWAVR